MNKYLILVREKLAKFTSRQKIVLFLFLFLLLLLGLVVIFSPRTARKPVKEGKFEVSAPSPVSRSFPAAIFAPVLKFLGMGRQKKELVSAPTPKLTPTAIPTPPFPYTRVIEETLAYIQSQYRDDGFYNYLAHYDEQCEEKEGKTVCPYEGERMFPQTNAWTSLAYLSGYRSLGDQKYLDLAKRDMDRLILHCESSPRDCLWVLVQVARFYQETKDSRYLNFLKQEGEILLTTSDLSPILLDIESRELVLIYQITGDNRFLGESKKRLVSAENFPRETIYTAYEKDKTVISFDSDICWLNLARLDFYKVTGQSEYLQKVKDFFDPAAEFHYKKAFYYLSQSQPCIESLLDLSQITQEKKFINFASSWVKTLIDQNWDSKSDKKKYGEGGFLVIADLNQKPYLILTDASYMVYLLAQLQNAK